MRKSWLALVLIVVSIVVQVTVLNGLRLPGGGVPDLVLVLVAAFAVAEGPLAGLAIGFAAGLCLDLAPPGSLLIGQYALVFCLAGWTAGRLGRAGRSAPLRSAVVMAITVAAAEALSAGIGLVLEPAEVTVAAIRAVLPATVGYDLVLCPFALYLVVVTGSVLTQGLAAGAAAGGLPGVPDRSKRAKQRLRRPLQPRMVHAASATGGGRRSGGRDYHHAPSARTRARLRPANGVAGSASGLVRQPGRHPGAASRAAPSLRLASGRRGDRAIGGWAGSGSANGRRGPGRHPGRPNGTSRPFRPRGGQPGGSATRQHGPAATGPARGRTAIKFSAHRGDGTLGRTLGSAAPGRPRRAATVPLRLRTGTSRSALSTRRSLPRVVPKVQFRSQTRRPVRRPAAAPRFRRASPGFRQSGTVSGGALNHGASAARRRGSATPRLRLGAGRRGSGPRGAGMLGGSGRSPLRGPRVRIGKQPRFGYGRRSPLSFLAARRVGGSWLARKRAGSRSGAWLIGKRTGGTR